MGVVVSCFQLFFNFLLLSYAYKITIVDAHFWRRTQQQKKPNNIENVRKGK